MSEGSPPEATPEAPEEVSIGLDNFPTPPKVGSKIPMEVTGVDEENGTVSLRCSHNSPQPKGSGIAKMASAYDEGE